MPLVPGTPVGPYTIVESLGAGGMGEVYRARDARLDRDAALKIIRGGAERPDDAVDRLLAEATLASQLNHPNIVTIYDTGVAGGDRYLAMELVQGSTLRHLATQGLSVERALEISRQIAEALAVAHANHIVHRDVKPENVMVRPDGYVKVLDFGLARLHAPVAAAGPTLPASHPGMLVGTVAYMSPEQARGEPASAGADVFALGILMYELLTGRHPFATASHLGTLHALIWDAPEPPARINPELPRTIEQLVLECLNKDPRLRPGAEEVMLRLSLARHASVEAALAQIVVPARPRGHASLEVVGRDAELASLARELDRTQRGQGRLVVVSAEAGMGKTTLVEAFLNHVQAADQAIRVGRGRCSERLAGSEAYLPVLEALDNLQRDEQLGNLSRVMRTVAPNWYLQIMSPATDGSSAERLAVQTSGGSPERLKRELVAFFDEVARLHPVILCFDDVQWADPSTTDLIGYMAQRLDTMRVLIVVTARPSDLSQARHPFLALKLDLLTKGIAREIIPGFLDTDAIARYTALRFPEHGFPAEFAAVIHRRTEGHPLFVADLLRDLRRRHLVVQADGRWVLAADLTALEGELPQSVRSLLQRKMDALDAADRRLLGAASVQGVDFDSAVLASVMQDDPADVEDRLERIERDHALVRFVDEWEYPDRTLTLRYRFAHHVYHQGFFDALRATRRATLSRSIAENLVQRLGRRAADHGADLALLFETARDNMRAAEYFALAARSASRLYAHEEAIHLAARGLDLLLREPDSPARARIELDLQMAYALAVKTGRGYAVPEAGRAYARSRELCRQVDDPSRVIPVLVGMSAHHLVSGEITTSRDVALEMLQLFERLRDPHLQMIGEWSLGAALFHLSALQPAHQHLSRALELYDPVVHRPRVWETGMEPGVFCRSELSRTLVLLGFPDQGLACVLRAVADARAIDHPQPLAFALLFEIMIHLARRSPSGVLRAFDELSTICNAHGIAQELQWAVPLRGRALIELGETAEGLREIEEGLAAHTLTRSALMRPYYLVLLAGALLRCDRLDAARRALDEAAVVAAETGQHAYDAEHYRIEGVIFSRQGHTEQAEAAYRQALAIARAQGARWLELRAARALADFLVAFDRAREAKALLAPVVAEMKEGQDTRDYVYADALLKSV
jgi:predicted ATPase